MIEALISLFGMGPKVDYAELVKQGALVVDVRSKGEYAGGHIKGSINIPVDQINTNTGRLADKNKVIITCCASGMRSGAAKNILKSKGYTQVYNGGSWMSLQHKL
jgi:phage shock protein E